MCGLQNQYALQTLADKFKILGYQFIHRYSCASHFTRHKSSIKSFTYNNMYCATNLQLICSMTTYPHLNTIPGHMLHYGVCTNEPFQFTEIQSANSAIENSLYSRRKSTAWPAVLIEDGIDNTNEIGMQEDIIVIKTESNLDSDRYLMDSPLPDCIISPDQSPGMETSDISQSQVNAWVELFICFVPIK